MKIFQNINTLNIYYSKYESQFNFKNPFSVCDTSKVLMNNFYKYFTKFNGFSPFSFLFNNFHKKFKPFFKI